MLLYSTLLNFLECSTTIYIEFKRKKINNGTSPQQFKIHSHPNTPHRIASMTLSSSSSIRFAAALKDMNVWVMNVVPVDSADTLPIIYERGLFGMYHDWCESFSTYPRSYDLLHADHLFSKLKKRSLHTTPYIPKKSKRIIMWNGGSTFFRHFPHSELS